MKLEIIHFKDLVFAALKEIEPQIGGVVKNGQKNKSPPISTQFEDIVGFAFIKM
jgi:hypothetical protein